MEFVDPSLATEHIDDNQDVSIDNSAVKFYGLGDIPIDQVKYVTAVGRHNGEWLLVRKHEKDLYEFPGGKIEDGETAEDALIREIQEETGANVSRIMALANYQFDYSGPSVYGRLYYCEFDDVRGSSDGSEIAEVVTSSTVEDLSVDAKHLSIYDYTSTHRRVINDWFHLDTRKLFGRDQSITVGNNTISISPNIADPMHITQTIRAFFERYLKGDVRGPVQLDVNATSRCPDSCVFCFNSTDRDRDFNQLDPGAVKEAIDYLCKNTNLMHLKSSGFGDPLVYPHLWEIFRYSKELGLVNSLNTNGKNLSRHLENVIKYVDSIRFSIDAWSADQFLKVHGAKDFDKRIEDIEKLVKMRDSHHPELIVGMHFVVLPVNLSGVEDMIRWAIAAGVDFVDITLDKFSWGYMYKWTQEDIDDAIKSIYELKKYVSPNFNIIFPSDVTVSDHKLEAFRDARLSHFPCWQISLRHYLTPAGEYGACNAFESQPIRKRVAGNIYTDSMQDILEVMDGSNDITSKDAECRNCVIPHGIFNDLCDFVYQNTGN